MPHIPKTPELSFQAYQRVFAQHIRNPSANAMPSDVPIKRMAIYTEIVYNNIEGVVAACFPVTKSILGAKKWQSFVRSFMANYQASSPIFREIPKQFLDYLESAPIELPLFLTKLMHYEWVELALSVMEVTDELAAPEDVLRSPIMLNPGHFLLQYDFPVHKISINYQPKKSENITTYLLVYRDASYQVQFMELNPITFQLVTLIKNSAFSGEQVLRKLAADNPQIATEIVLQFGAQTLEALSEKGVIVGVKIAQ